CRTVGSGPGWECADRNLDAPGLCPLCVFQTFRGDLLAHPSTHHRGDLAAGTPDPFLCRRELGQASVRLLGTAREKHCLPCGSGRHFRGSQTNRKAVLPERRCSEHSPFLWHTTGGEGL